MGRTLMWPSLVPGDSGSERGEPKDSGFGDAVKRSDNSDDGVFGVFVLLFLRWRGKYIPGDLRFALDVGLDDIWKVNRVACPDE